MWQEKAELLSYHKIRKLKNYLVATKNNSPTFLRWSLFWQYIVCGIYDGCEVEKSLRTTLVFSYLLPEKKT